MRLRNSAGLQFGVPVLVVAVLVPLFLFTNAYNRGLLVLIVIYAVAALSLDYIMGEMGTILIRARRLLGIRRLCLRQTGPGSGNLAMDRFPGGPGGSRFGGLADRLRRASQNPGLGIGDRHPGVRRAGLDGGAALEAGHRWSLRPATGPAPQRLRMGDSVGVGVLLLRTAGAAGDSVSHVKVEAVPFRDGSAQHS